MQPPDEYGWVLAAQTGDKTAFAALVPRYWERIRRWAFALLGDAHASEDITQEVFFKAWKNIDKLQTPSHFRPWLFRIARNIALDYRKSPKSAPGKPIPIDTSSTEPSPESAARERELKDQIDAACRRMPAKYRDAYLLWVEESMEYTEIAFALQTTAITARWRVCKARESLRQALKSYLELEQT